MKHALLVCIWSLFLFPRQIYCMGEEKNGCFALRVVSLQLIMLSAKKVDSLQPLSLLLFWRPPRSNKDEGSKH